jgi:cellulose synthase/poly-beta-1,6-N-acetylglucosamine synthase-like glycosyltransferase
MIVFAANLLISLVGVVLIVQLLWLLAQVLASLRSDNSLERPIGRRSARVCVIIPAHDEASSIASTIAAIQPQLRETDRLLIVADNCGDETAAIAIGAGAEAIERHDTQRLGKGFALDYAMNHLKSHDAPDVVIFVDADCLLAPGSVDQLAEICADRQSPAQATNLMVAGESAGSSARIAEFAWKVKNYIRPLGAHRLGFPCSVTGTGMAFPWALISSAELATNHIVEDTKLGVDLMIAGHNPIFCPAAKVTSKFAAGQEGTRIQRTRWEHGHLMMILEYAPRLLRAAYQQRKFLLFVMAIDLSIPPLGLMALVIAILALLGVAIAFVGFPNFTVVLAIAPAWLFGATIFLAWLRYGRDILSRSDLLSIPRYALSKIPMLWRFIFRRQKAWIRSLRDTE